MRRELGGGGGGHGVCTLGCGSGGPGGPEAHLECVPWGCLGARPRSWMKSRGAALGPASASVSSHPLITSI